MTASQPRSRFDTSINYYQILDVPYGASKEEITRAYRALMRITHPDNFQEPRERAKAEERAKLINVAYTVLSRPDTRQEYDKQMRSTAMADALMQRYTGGAPGRPSPVRAHPRPPAPHIVRAQRQAYNSAVRQLLLTTAALVGVMIVLILLFGLLGFGLDSLVG